MKNSKIKNKKVFKNGAIGGYVYYNSENKWKWRIIGNIKKCGGSPYAPPPEYEQVLQQPQPQLQPQPQPQPQQQQPVLPLLNLGAVMAANPEYHNVAMFNQLLNGSFYMNDDYHEPASHQIICRVHDNIYLFRLFMEDGNWLVHNTTLFPINEVPYVFNISIDAENPIDENDEISILIRDYIQQHQLQQQQHGGKRNKKYKKI